MRRIHIRELIAQPMVEAHVFHESGEHLCSSATGFGPHHVRAFQEAGIDHVYVLDGYDNLVQFSIERRNKFILTDELVAKHRLIGPILGMDGGLLVRFGERNTEELKTRLKRHGYYSVCVKKTQRELRLDQVEAFRRHAGGLRRSLSGRRYSVRSRVAS